MKWSCLPMFCLALAGCSEQPAAPDEAEGQSTLQSSAAAPAPTTQPVLSDEEVNQLAPEFGVDPAKVRPLIQGIEEAKQELRGELATGSMVAVKTRLLNLADKLSPPQPQPHGNGQLGPEMATVAADFLRNDQSQAIYKAGFMGLDDAALKEQIELHSGTEEVARENGALLLDTLLDRQSKAPSPADWILFAATISGLAENSDFHRTGDQEADGTPPQYGPQFLALATSENPVYRLLAVQIAPNVEWDSQKLISFYRQFKSEADPVVREAAIGRLRNLNPANLEEVLEEFPPSERQ